MIARYEVDANVTKDDAEILGGAAPLHFKRSVSQRVRPFAPIISVQTSRYHFTVYIAVKKLNVVFDERLLFQNKNHGFVL